MNIGLLTYTLSERSGARAPIRLAEALKELGHEMTVYGYDVGQDEKMVARLRSSGIKVVIYPANLSIPFSLRGYGSIFKVAEDLRNAKHDVISFHSTLPSMLAARLSGIKVLKTYYGTELSYYQIRRDAGLPIALHFVEIAKSKIFDYLLMTLEWVSLTLSHKTFSISKFLAKEAKTLYGKNIGVIYLGAESSLVNQNKTTNNIGRYILSVSRIVPYKGFDLLIEAFKKANQKISDLKLIIVGSTAGEDYLNYLKGISNENVEFRKNITDSELAGLYSNCILYASADLWVPWSLTPLEAAFFGKPSAALSKGAMSEIINDKETGLLSEDTEGLSENIIDLIEDRDKAKKLGQKAKDFVNNFDWKKTASEYEKELQKLI